MRYAYGEHEMTAPLGVEPQPSCDEITIESFDGQHVIPVYDLEQLNQLRGLLDHAAIILQWENAK